jgi:hypothetical protein
MVFRDRVKFTEAEIAAYYRERLSKLMQRGRQWRGVCPLHQGARFSLSVNAQTGCWYCFAECARGGSLIDFEMTLTGATFKTALATACTIAGHRMPARARMTREEWQVAHDAREREKQECRGVLYFVDAVATLAADVLEDLGPFEQERAVYTQLIEGLRHDARVVFRDWRDRDPNMTAALVEAGRRNDWLLQTRLLHFMQEIASEGCRDAA